MMETAIFLPPPQAPEMVSIVKSGASVGTFIIDFDGRVQEESGECGMEAPNWGFN